MSIGAGERWASVLRATSTRVATLFCAAVLGICLLIGVSGCRAAQIAPSQYLDVSLAPTASFDALVAQAHSAIDAGQYLRATALVEQSLTSPFSGPDQLLLIAELFVRLENLERAREFLAQRLQEGESTEACNLLGYLRARQGYYALASRQFQNVLRTDASNLYARVCVGATYLQLGKTHEAIDALESARALDPAGARQETRLLDYYLGLAYRTSGEQETALQAFQRAERRAPEDPQIARETGRAYEAGGNWHSAQEAYRRATVLDPHDSQSRAKVAMLARRMAQTPIVRPTQEPVEEPIQDIPMPPAFARDDGHDEEGPAPQVGVGATPDTFPGEEQSSEVPRLGVQEDEAAVLIEAVGEPVLPPVAGATDSADGPSETETTARSSAPEELPTPRL